MKLYLRAAAILKRLPRGPCRAAEVGVWIGELSEQLLRRHAGLTLLMVDRWAAVPLGHPYRDSGSQVALRTDEEFEAAYAEALSRTAFANGRTEVLRGESTAMAASVPPGSLHLAFLDDDHTYEGVTAGLEAWLPAVKRNGWIGGHDWAHPDQGDVQNAVLDYRAGHGIKSRLIFDMHRTWFWRVRA